MSVPATVFAVWITGAVVLGLWFRINQWGRTGETLTNSGFPDTMAVRYGVLALLAAAWFAIPVIALLDKEAKR